MQRNHTLLVAPATPQKGSLPWVQVQHGRRAITSHTDRVKVKMALRAPNPLIYSNSKIG